MINLNGDTEATSGGLSLARLNQANCRPLFGGKFIRQASLLVEKVGNALLLVAWRKINSNLTKLFGI